MKNTVKVKTAIDAAMSLAMLLLMAYGLIGEKAHEWIGIAMFALFVTHHILNHRWICNAAKGRYTPLRIVQTVTAALILACMLGSMISGIIISRYVFDFLKISETPTAVKVHTLCAYWGFVLMSFHLGLHWNMFVSMAQKHLGTSKLRANITRAVGILIAGYGIYAFICRDIGIYLFLRSHFVFFDFSEPVIFFLLDHLAVMGLFAAVGYWTSALIRIASKHGIEKQGK